MYYYQNHNKWEKKLTRDIVTNHKHILEEALNLGYADKIIVEFQKNRYQKHGDVDLAILKNAGSGTQDIIAAEIKVIHLNEKGGWESEKIGKHNKQINALIKEGWDYVYFFDFIVTKEEPNFIHSQSFDGFDRYRKNVEHPACGHIVFQIENVFGVKPKRMSLGSRMSLGNVFGVKPKLYILPIPPFSF
jgi:hypothetical protein